MPLKRLFGMLAARKNSLFLSLLYGCILLFLLRHCYALLLYGGGNFQQADWLINNELVTVRRGVFGSCLLHCAAWFDVNPLALLIGFQALISTVIICSLWYAGIRHRTNDAVFFLLISPLFLGFWFLDRLGGLRKECLGYMAFLPYLVSAGRHGAIRSLATACSLIIYLVAVFSHEVNIFFAPFLIIAALTAARQRPENGLLTLPSLTKFFTGNPYAVMISCTYALFACAGCAYVLAFSNVTDTMLICKPLLAIPGINSEICTGAISYLDKDAAFAFRRIFSTFLCNPVCMRNALLTLLFSAGLWYVSAATYSSGTKTLFFYGISFLVFLPLFLVSSDWGRIFSHHVYCLSLLLLIFLRAYPSEQPRKLSPAGWLLLLGLCCSVGIHHTGTTILDPALSRGYLALGAAFLKKSYLDCCGYLYQLFQASPLK